MQLLRKLVHTVQDKRYRRWLAIGILLLTFILFVRFFVTHPEYLERLRRVSPITIIIVLLLYIPATLSLVWSSSAIVRLCGGHIGRKENVLLTAYSSIINFFGPLQSGPGVRAIYLKTRHGIRMRDFMLAMLLYYALYASFSAVMFLIGVRPWWQTILGLLAVVGFSALVIRRFARRSHHTTDEKSGFRLDRAALIALTLAVLFQLVCMVSYFYVELHAVNPHISISQAVSYTGAANFALFVSVTPGATGIREAFLVLSQQVHHVSTVDIVNANIIDRGSNVLYLTLLFLAMLGVHARERLHLRGKRRATAAT